MKPFFIDVESLYYTREYGSSSAKYDELDSQVRSCELCETFR